MPFNAPYQLQWESIAQPITKGLQLRFRGRIADPAALSVAENVEYLKTGGAQKRCGHTAATLTVNPNGQVVTPSAINASISPFQPKSLDPRAVIGSGGYLGLPDVKGTDRVDSQSSTAIHALGAFELNGSGYTWTGDQVVGPGQATEPRAIPVARMTTRTVDGTNGDTAQYCRIPGRGFAVSTGANISFYSVDGAFIASHSVVGMVGNHPVVLAPINNVFVAFFKDSEGVSASTYSQEGTLAYTKRVIALPGTGRFDVKVHNRTHGQHLGATVVASDGSQFHLARLDRYTTVTAYTAQPVASGELLIHDLACDVSRLGNVAVALVSATTTTVLGEEIGITSYQFGPDYVLQGSSAVPLRLGTGHFLEPGSMSPIINRSLGAWCKIAVAYRSHRAAPSNNQPKIDIFCSGLFNQADLFSVPPAGVAHTEVTESVAPMLRKVTVSTQPGGSLVQASTVAQCIAYCEVVSSAHCYGYAGAFMAQYHGPTGGRYVSKEGNIGLASMEAAQEYHSAQPTALLLDNDLKVLGVVNHSASVASYHWMLGDEPSLCGVVMPKARQVLLPQQAWTSGEFIEERDARETDEYLVLVDFDFAHPLTSATGNRSKYFAGAQVWQYDGRRLFEANSPIAPEIRLNLPQGDPVDTKTYLWRVEFVRTNDQGEDTVSYSIPYLARGTSPVPLAVKVYAPRVILHNGKVRMRVYRTEGNGSVFYLVHDATLYDFTSPGMTYDTGKLAWDIFTTSADWYPTDNGLSRKETHPTSQVGFLMGFPAPACEHITQCNERLWVSGGQTLFGGVAASNLSANGTGFSWNPYHYVAVDSELVPVTDIAAIENSVIVMKRSGIFAITSDGPDNNGQGPQWPVPRRISLAGSSRRSTAIETPAGLFFVGRSGLYVVNSSGGVSPVGDADTVFASVTPIAAVCSPEKDQARWYCTDGTVVVFDYRESRFSTWTGLVCNGVAMVGGTARLAKSNGTAWVEATNLQSVWTDAGASITMRISTSWLNRGLGSYMRVRRVLFFGEWLGEHGVRLRVYRNEETAPSETCVLDWSAQGSAVPPSWGGLSWGEGEWGGGTTGGAVWRWSHTLTIQKCSVVRFEIDDMGADSAGFVPVVVGLEVGTYGLADKVRSRY